jgi:1,4-dihydroxy-2-naphthoyl-CoA hydrolase
MTEENPLPAGVTREQALDLANQAMAGTLMERIGVEWVEMGSERVVARIPVEGNTQVYGQLHGGATGALCESVGSFGTAIVVGMDKQVVGVDLSVHHLRAVRDGHVTCTGIPLRVGRQVAVWDMRVTDDQDRLVAVGRLTVAIRGS